MSDPIWPVTLPQDVLIGSSEALTSYVARTAMDVGPPKVRRRATAVKRTFGPLRMIITADLVDIFDAFFVTTCASGSLQFSWVDPRKNGSMTLRFSGAPSYKNLGPGTTKALWEVTFSVEQP